MVLDELVRNAFENGVLEKPDEFRNALKARENIVSTGIGLGVAVPHAKLPDIKAFFTSIAILKDKVDWDAIDQALVNIVFLIGGPDNQQTEYLKLLSKIILLIKNPGRRNTLLKCKTQEETLALFENL
ncbi:MAG: PTS sugar transporter subunit IIA [Spirochaetales bacterium]|nr:MAG: PTS sugar transporter subunit IIA [Spirochaetales bacterium]